MILRDTSTYTAKCHQSIRNTLGVPLAMLQQEQQRDIVAFCHLHSTFLREKKTTYTIGTLFENHHKTISFSFHLKNIYCSVCITICTFLSFAPKTNKIETVNR